MNKKAIGLLVAILLLPLTPANGQVITGRVVQQGTDAAIVEALVTLSDEVGGHQRTQRTSSQGSYRFVLDAPGQARIRARRLGFRPFVSAVVRLEAGDTLTLPVELIPVPQELSRVTVNAEVEAVKDLRIVGYNARSMETVVIPCRRLRLSAKRPTHISTLSAICISSS